MEIKRRYGVTDAEFNAQVQEVVEIFNGKEVKELIKEDLDVIKEPKTKRGRKKK
jgi:hypothetical protein